MYSECDLVPRGGVGNERMKRFLVCAVGLGACVAAQATVFVVDAKLNSSTGGTAKPTLVLTAGQAFTLNASTTDLWSLGNPPRWCNANGLTSVTFATGSDESGLPAGTQIGANWGPLTQFGFTAPYGALVGRIGANYFLVGTNYAGVAPVAGTLELFNWDSNASDNSNSISVTAEAVPEPATLVLGAAGLAAALRRRRARR